MIFFSKKIKKKIILKNFLKCKEIFFYF